ncbi:MAG: hypothetical protein RSB09_02305 [Clostridia bacterium]
MENFVVHETDERMFYLKDMLGGVTTKTTTHIFAPNVLLTAKLLADTLEDSIVIGGRADNEAKALFNSLDITYFNMLENEEFQAANARMTAEGALATLIDHSALSLADMSVLIIGFGRTGAAMARILCEVGIRSIDIATTASARPAHALANRVIPAENFDFSPYDAIINTAPVAIIADHEALTIKQSAVYIDLASVPAINLEYARYLGLDADIYPVIPARTSPLSAAKAIKNYITGVLK